MSRFRKSLQAAAVWSSVQLVYLRNQHLLPLYPVLDTTTFAAPVAFAVLLAVPEALSAGDCSDCTVSTCPFSGLLPLVSQLLGSAAARLSASLYFRSTYLSKAVPRFPLRPFCCPFLPVRERHLAHNIRYCLVVDEQIYPADSSGTFISDQRIK